MDGELSASEALYGFMAWLTTRDKEVKLSSHEPAGEAAQLVDKFCKVNGLTEPREGWDKFLVLPVE